MAKSTRKKGVGPVLAAAAGIDMPEPPQDRESLRVRKITNGYLVCHEGVKNGRYFEREIYTKIKPKLPIPSVRGNR